MPALNVRFDEDTLGLIKQAALSKKQSLNAWLLDAAREKILHQAHRRGPDGAALAAELDRRTDLSKRKR